MQRDFTYIDDIVQGILGAIKTKKSGHWVYNLGNSQPEILENFISLIEQNLGMKANKNYLPIQPGDVEKTFANIDLSKKDLKFKPKTSIFKGIPKFIEWYKDYYKL